MNRTLMTVAAITVLLTACGNDEAPKKAQAPAPMMEQPKPAAPMAEAPAEEAVAPMEEMAAPMEEAAPAPMAEEEAAAEPATAPQADGDRGKQVYGMVCFACHDQGVAGAPKLGDKALWGPRIAQGNEILVSHAINGFQGSTGVMPPKGGRMDLSDEDIAAAVDYMVGQSQ